MTHYQSYMYIAGLCYNCSMQTGSVSMLSFRCANSLILKTFCCSCWQRHRSKSTKQLSVHSSTDRRCPCRMCQRRRWSAVCLSTRA